VNTQAHDPQREEQNTMPDDSSWTRPIRIPESVPIEHSDPDHAFAGQTSTWRLRFRLARDVPSGAELRLQLWGGRNNRGVFATPQTDRPGASGHVSAALEDGTALALEPAERAGTLRLVAPEGGLAVDDVLTVTLGTQANDPALSDY
jgi:hypothetical protein